MASTVFLSVFAFVPDGTAAPGEYRYHGSGATVVGGGSPALDDGGVVCDGTGGAGGVCIPWPAASPGGDRSIAVDDDSVADVAYQVCVDNDGDGTCGGTPTVAGCADDITYSHGPGATWANPLQAPPAEFEDGCPGGYEGWIVYICEAVHTDGVPHTHHVTAGTVTLEPFADGGTSGDFCAGSRGKPYVVADSSDASGSFTGETDNTAGACPQQVRELVVDGVFRTSGGDFAGQVEFEWFGVCQISGDDVLASGTLDPADFATPAGPAGFDLSGTTQGTSPRTCAEGTMHGGTYTRAGNQLVVDVTLSYDVYEANALGECPGPGGVSGATVVGSQQNLAVTAEVNGCCPAPTPDNPDRIVFVGDFTSDP